MQFKAQVLALNEAFARASVVKPTPVNPDLPAGYLLVVQGSECHVYSEDEHQKSRVTFPVYDAEEGSAAAPARIVAPLSCLEGEISLQSSVVDGVHQLEYSVDGGASQTLTSFDARSLQSLDSDLESAETVNTFPTSLLREALSTAKPFLADLKDSKVKECHKCLQIFDSSKPEWAKGNGYLFGASGYTACYFYSKALEDHGLSLHGLRIPSLVAFLSKSVGTVTLKRSSTSTYFVNEAGQVLGWADVVTNQKKFDYYPLSADSHVLRVEKTPLVKALTYVQKALEAGNDRVRFVYDAENGAVKILASSDGRICSPPVVVQPLGPEDGIDGGKVSKSEDVECNFKIDYLVDLFSATKSHLVELRVCPFPARKGSYIFRTIEGFVLDEEGRVKISSSEGEKDFECRVTRIAPSRA